MPLPEEWVIRYNDNLQRREVQLLDGRRSGFTTERPRRRRWYERELDWVGATPHDPTQPRPMTDTEIRMQWEREQEAFLREGYDRWAPASTYTTASTWSVGAPLAPIIPLRPRRKVISPIFLGPAQGDA